MANSERTTLCNTFSVQAAAAPHLGSVTAVLLARAGRRWCAHNRDACVCHCMLQDLCDLLSTLLGGGACIRLPASNACSTPLCRLSCRTAWSRGRLLGTTGGTCGRSTCTSNGFSATRAAPAGPQGGALQLHDAVARPGAAHSGLLMNPIGPASSHLLPVPVLRLQPLLLHLQPAAGV